VALRSVETPSGLLILDEERGFVRIKNKRGVEQTLEDARNNIAELFRLTEGKPYPILVDLEGTSLARDVRTYYGGVEVRDKLRALALLVTNPVASVVANFFLGMKHHRTPTRMFTSEREAIEWLRAFRPER
jgi:hypothetical protein